MNLIVIHQNKDISLNGARDLLRFAICSEPLAGIILSCLDGNSCPRSDDEAIAIPQAWAGQATKDKLGVVYYKDNIPVYFDNLSRLNAKSWFTVSNGRFVTRINCRRLHKVLFQLSAEVVAVNVLPSLQAGRERVLADSQGKLIGVRRVYDDSAQTAPIPDDWPHHLFIKTDVLKKLLDDNTLPLSFTKLIDNCFSNSLTVSSLNVGGAILDLGTEEGLLGFVAVSLNSNITSHRSPSKGHRKEILNKDNVRISPDARLSGKVLFGQDVSIGPNAIIVGPTIIGSGVKIAKGAVVRASIVGSGVSVIANSVLQNCVLTNGHKLKRQAGQVKTNCRAVTTNDIANHKNFCADNFRTWPRYSYARCAKRIADIAIAVVVLILFAPVFPIIAIVVKLTSRGPVFFKDVRQGRHGKVFNCLKFRTMLVGADDLQDKLRVLNQADGPQFKMADDPRISTVGRFLRDTYIDEIPQFFNVLLGQMSVVGPRPSPELENTLCPYWRDARLSVSPGITGLWQVYRTRQPMKDFQEWIYYDTKYVRNLSLKMDLLICWQTAKKMVKNFVSQF